MFQILVIIIIILIVLFLFGTTFNSKKNNKDTLENKNDAIDLNESRLIPLTNNNVKKEDFEIIDNDNCELCVYNHFNVPINIKLNCDLEINDLNCEECRCINNSVIPIGTKVCVFTCDGLPLSESTIEGSEGAAPGELCDIKELHCGMITSHYDIVISAEPTKSPLGTALPRVRLVNLLKKPLKLNYNIIIPPGRSLMYYGEYENGIPLGTRFRDFDGILNEFIAYYPISDIFFGVTANVELPPHVGSHFGNNLDYTTGLIEFPLAYKVGYQYHRGSSIDRTYIPKNW